MTDVWTWGALGVLGAYHGINPAMGWLFAVALGFQERSRRAVLAALPPIALGHGISVALVAALVGGASVVIDPGLLRALGAAALIVFGVYKFLRRSHPRWVGMRVSGRDLVAWSFLMSTAHGAGLMLFPVLVSTSRAGHAHGAGALASAPAGVVVATAATLVHTAAMFLVMGATAVLVYDRLGVAFLRRAWLNTDAAWAGALVAAGVITLVV